MRTLEIDGVPAWSKIGLGTWQFGSREWGYGEAYARREAGAMLRRALDLGVTLIDTAEIYAFGESERIIGEALAGRRDEAFLASKVFPVAAFAPVVEQRARASLRRLGTDRLDLYQLHWPNPAVPIASQMAGMRRLRVQGLVQEVGVSNFDLARWRAAEDRARRARAVEPGAAQPGGAPVRRSAPGLGPGERARGHRLQPLAQGLLSGRYGPGNVPGGVRRGNPLFLPENLDRAAHLLATLREVATAHDVTPAQAALAWTVRHPNVVAIPGAASVAQLEANAQAGDLELADDEAAALTAASDAFRPLGPADTARALARRTLAAVRR